MLFNGYDRMQKAMTVMLVMMFFCFFIIAMRSFGDVGDILAGLFLKFQRTYRYRERMVSGSAPDPSLLLSEAQLPLVRC